MPWSVRLEDESGKAVSNRDAGIEFEVLDHVKPDGLLRYIDPYGDTIFNRLQIADFIAEWKTIKPSGHSQEEEWRRVLNMALQCEAEVHTYLRFVGD